MEDSLYFGAVLMAVGMSTVFLILTLVVLGGKVMIFIINKYAPQPAPLTAQLGSSGSISLSKIAAISAVVKTITQGRGQVTEIKKQKD